MAKKLELEEEKVAAKPALDKDFDFDSFEINSIEDIHTWNRHAHKAFRDAKKNNPRCDPPIPVKVPDESYHKKVKVKFQRFDQPENLLKIKVHTKDISWRGQLKPGCNYDLPIPVVKFLNKLAVPIFAEVKVQGEGETRSETKQVGERNRFSCHLLEIE